MKTRLAARATVWFPLLLLAVLTGLSFWLEQLVTSGEPVRDARSRHDPDLILQSLNAEKLGPAGVPIYRLAAKTLLRNGPTMPAGSGAVTSVPSGAR